MSLKNKLRQFSLACLAALALSQMVAHADQPGYHLDASKNLSGGAHWDYLTFDPTQDRLFIAHADHVDVFDVHQQAVTGSIPDTSGVHGVAMIPSMNLGFTSNGKSDNVTVFRLSDLGIVGHIATGGKPDAIVYDPASGHIFTANGKGRSLTIIDPHTQTSLGNIALDAKPEFTVADDQGHLFTNAEDKNQIIRTDTRTNTVTARYNLAPQCDAPTGLAIDKIRHRLFSACQNDILIVVNADDGHIMQTLPIDAKNDAVAYDEARNLVFSANGAGTLTVIGAKDASQYQVEQVVTTQAGARTLALDPDTGTVYLVTATQTGNNQPAQFELLTVTH